MIVIEDATACLLNQEKYIYNDDFARTTDKWEFSWHYVSLDLFKVKSVVIFDRF